MLEEGDEFWRDVKGAWIDILRDVDVGDVEIQGCRAGYQGHNGQVEETVIHRDSASLDDANVGATDSESDGDTQENPNAHLLLVSWECRSRVKRKG